MNIKRRVVALGLATVVVGGLTVGGVALATTTSGQANGDCKMGYYTSNDPVYGGIAAQVSLNKNCPGPVEGRFTGQIIKYTWGPTSGTQATTIVMRATCTATGGFASPCTVGQVVTASPGSTTLSSCNADLEPCSREGTRGMNMVWPSLARGVWSFEVEATASGADWLAARTFTVEAFNG